jgi:aminopeptidase N
MKPEFAGEVDRFATAPQYQIDLRIAPDLKSYSATQVVTYTNAETVTLPEVYFSLFTNLDSYGGNLQVQSLRVNGHDVEPVLEEDNAALKVALTQPLKPGQSITVALTYTGTVPASEIKPGYDQFGLHHNVLALPNFYPQIPAYDDHGWHITPGPGYGDTVFSDTALYQVNITAPAEEVVAASGVCNPVKDSQPTQGFQTLHCVSGPMRDFMIAMSPDYDVKSDIVDGVKINSYSRKADDKGSAQALQAAVEAVRSYDRRFGPYPFNELDVVATPTTAGGIEYPGLIAIADRLYQDGGSMLDLVVAHEAAHQWWYSLVGDDQVNDPWLDEALAEFSSALFFRDRYGDFGMNALVQYWQMTYDQVKGKPDDKRADLPVSAYSESQYGEIVYNKAPLFYYALYQALGDEKFDQFLQEYFRTYRYGVAYPQDLFAIAAKHAGQDTVDVLKKEWITTP